MSFGTVERIASTLLYEGYLLYPYRRSAIKNRQRFNFGVIYPEAYSRAQGGTDPAVMQTECLLRGTDGTRLDVAVRFLHLFTRGAEQPGEPEWHEAIERRVTLRSVSLGEIPPAGRIRPFGYPPADRPGRRIGLEGRIDLSAEPAADGVVRLRIVIENHTPMADDLLGSRDEAMLRSLVSAHTMVRATDGEFISLLEPPEALAPAAAACRNVGTWPVLAGDDRARGVMLSSPIIVSDFPEIAPESPADFFDGTEMDEMLSLRILTLTDEEKREMGASDERARRLLERIEAFGPEELMRMHGVLREMRSLGEGP